MRKAITTAVTIWLQGLRNSVLATMTSDGLPTGLPWGMPNLECNSSSTLTWQDGPSFYQFLMNVSYDDVSFNELGQLKSRDISIVNVQPSGNGPNQRKWTEVGPHN
ncbi:uncharacterized protein LOC118477381 [Aplysia californica]|uniref:Uncharacterized protein LOC118477381 n=1 Tax=Aplysia californica TaxID=6500 RepID=A0ABM1VQA4_APLCA|nr:uncharacterized protein LOC118477381 [Aplysia californica]